MSESGTEKTCVICGQSCAGQPRIKNARGQYAHRACAEKKSIKPAASEPDPIDTEEDDLMAGLLDDLPEADPAAGAGGMQAGCPGCGNAISGVVCMSCGFDTRSGKAAKVKVSTERAPGASDGAKAAAATVGAYAAAGTTFLVGSLAGAVVGGALGAAIWAGITIGTGFSIGYIAIGVGVLAGIGAAVGSRGQTGMVTGLIALAVTMVAVPAGRYFAIKHLVDSTITSMQEGDYDASSDFNSMTRAERFENFGVVMADTIVGEQLGTNLSDAKRDEYLYLLDYGVFPDDYPRHIVSQSRSRFQAMDQDEQERFVEAYIAGQRSVQFRMTEADRILSERLQEGGLDAETSALYTTLVEEGIYPYMYPPEIVEQADAAWASLSEQEQDEYVEANQMLYDEFYEEEMQSVRESAYEEGFIASIRFRTIISFLFAIGVAYAVGSGGET